MGDGQSVEALEWLACHSAVAAGTTTQRITGAVSS